MLMRCGMRNVPAMSGRTTSSSTRSKIPVFRDLLTFMMEDPRNISFCAHLLFCSKNIERIGDHSTNIAETVVYLVTGEPLPTERPKGPSQFSEAPHVAM